MTTTRYLLPGYHILDSVTLESLNNNRQTLHIEELIDEINIYEDIYYPVMKCDIVISEPYNIPQYFPIFGEERIQITFEDDTDKTFNRQDFLIYSITHRQRVGMESQAYILHGISEEFVLDKNTLVSKAFIDKSPEFIVKELFSELSNPESIETSDEDDEQKINLNFIVPNVSPLEAIKWVTNRAVGKNKEANYVFFQTFNEKSKRRFVFKSIDKLVQKEPTKSKTLKLKIAGESLIKDMKEINVVRDFYILKNVDQLQNLTNGFHGSTLYLHDIQEKTLVKKELDYETLFNETNHLEKYPFGLLNTSKGEPIYSGKNSVSLFASTSKNQFDLGRETSDVDLWLQKRKSQLQQLDNFKIIAVVSGSGKIKVGDIVKFDFSIGEMMKKSKGEVDFTDKHFSGKFLVTAIRHQFKDKRYTTILELTKESIKNPADLKKK